MTETSGCLHCGKTEFCEKAESGSGKDKSVHSQERKEGLWVLGLQGSPLCFSYTIRDMVQWARYGSVGYASVRPEFGYLPHIKARMMALTPIHPVLKSGDRRIAGAFWQPP